MARKTFREFTLEGRPTAPGAVVIPRIVEERFLARLPPARAPDQCWDLTRCVSSPPPEFLDYTQLPWRAVDGRKYAIPAHRFSYLRHHGSISPHRMALHRCNRKTCVNPDHVYEGTAADNIADVWRDPISMGRYLERAMREPWSDAAKARARMRAAAVGITCEAVQVSRAA